MGSLSHQGEQLLVPLWGRFAPQDVPYSEYNALVSLYVALDGNNWTTSTNWLTDTTINNWYGVTVAGGHVTQINLIANNLAGDIEGVDWANLTTLTHLYLYSNAAVNGDITNFSVLVSMVSLLLNATGVSGDATSLSGLTSLTHLYLHTTSVSGGTIGTLVAMRGCQVLNCGWNQATVDAFLLDMYTERANFAYATPELQIQANNAAPSGVYQDATPPTTGLEYVFKLANDPDVEGFNTWTITYNGGVAP